MQHQPNVAIGVDLPDHLRKAGDLRVAVRNVTDHREGEARERRRDRNGTVDPTCRDQSTDGDANCDANCDTNAYNGNSYPNSDADGNSDADTGTRNTDTESGCS